MEYISKGWGRGRVGGELERESRRTGGVGDGGGRRGEGGGGIFRVFIISYKYKPGNI